MRTLANVDQLGWLFAQVQLAHRQDTGRQAFTVRWTGTLQPPVDGACTLSICPLRLNFRSGQTFREESTKIFVAEQPVLDSARAGGTFRADPVTLTAGQRVPLRVELSFACSSAGVIGDLPAVALLYWEAPGLARQLVPHAALATPDGRQPGLQGDYALQVGENQMTTTRVDSQLNFVWYHQCFVVSPLAELRAQLAEQLYAVASDPSTLARWESEPGTNPARWQAHWAVLESLTVARRVVFPSCARALGETAASKWKVIVWGAGRRVVRQLCGVYHVIRWRLRGIFGPNLDLDVVELCNRIRQSSNPWCCRCKDNCEETFRTLIDFARSLPVPRFGFGTCQRWWDSFCRRMPPEVGHPANECYRLAPAHFSAFPFRGHAAILVSTCERSVFYLNSPFWWGHGCIFTGDEIPPGWHPPNPVPDPWPNVDPDWGSESP